VLAPGLATLMQAVEVGAAAPGAAGGKGGDLSGRGKWQAAVAWSASRPGSHPTRASCKAAALLGQLEEGKPHTTTAMRAPREKYRNSFKGSNRFLATEK
jgi:hypothetical protein